MGWWHEPNAAHAFNLSWISVVATAVAAVWGVTTFMDTKSSLILCYGLENMVDFASSVVVVWRFYSPAGTDAAHEALLAKREQRAGVAISAVLAVLGFSVIVAALEEFATQGDKNDDRRTLLFMSAISFLVFGTLTWIKFRYAKLLDSPSLEKDAICSLIGTVLSGSLFLNTLIITAYDGLWWVDPFVAILCGFASLYVGFKALYVAMFVDALPICNPRWWVSSQGETTGNGMTTNGHAVDGTPKMTTELPPLTENDDDIPSSKTQDQNDDDGTKIV